MNIGTIALQITPTRDKTRQETKELKTKANQRQGD